MEKTIEKNQKLTPEVLAPYLPYGIRFFRLNDRQEDHAWKFVGFDTEQGVLKGIRSDYSNQITHAIGNIKPIVKPLDDLHMDHPAMIEMCKLHSIEYNGENTFVEIDSLQDYPFHAAYLPYECFIILLKYHFDVFGLIPAGLAVGANTVKEA